jgi:hypothetical protein
VKKKKVRDQVNHILTVQNVRKKKLKSEKKVKFQKEKKLSSISFLIDVWMVGVEDPNPTEIPREISLRHARTSMNNIGGW